MLYVIFISLHYIYMLQCYIKVSQISQDWEEFSRKAAETRIQQFTIIDGDNITTTNRSPPYRSSFPQKGRTARRAPVKIHIGYREAFERSEGAGCKTRKEDGDKKRMTTEPRAGASGVNVEEEEAPRGLTTLGRPGRTNDRRKKPPKRPVSSGVRLSLDRAPIRRRI